VRKSRPYRWYPYEHSEIAKAKRRSRPITIPGVFMDLDSIVLSIDEEFHVSLAEDLQRKKNLPKPKKHPARRRRAKDKKRDNEETIDGVKVRSLVRVITPRSLSGKRKTKRK